MLVKSQAVVLHQIKYNDSDSIVYLYSKDFGRISYLVANRRKKSALSQALFQPLSIIEYEGDHKMNRELQRIKEAQSIYAFQSIPFDPDKNIISLFLSEFLYRVLSEADANPMLFDYLVQSIEILDLCQKGTANFHLVFLIKLTRYMGFYPNTEDNHPGWYFDLQAGVFSPACPPHNAWLSPSDAQNFARLLRMNYENLYAFKFDRHERVALLKQMLNYYRLHLVEFPEIKSLSVLQSLYDDSK